MPCLNDNPQKNDSYRKYPGRDLKQTEKDNALSQRHSLKKDPNREYP
jgi:hypothetical protein